MTRNKRPIIAVLASGSGTTAEALIHQTQTRAVDAEVGVVISNNEEAGVFDRVDRLCRQYDITIARRVINSTTHPGGTQEKFVQTDEESQAICEAGESVNAELYLCLGYLRKIRGPLLEKDILNSHPGPLPLTAGLIGEACAQKVLESGEGMGAVTTHRVFEDYDSTKDIVATVGVPVIPGDTPATLGAATQTTEKAWIGRIIDDYLFSRTA